MRQVRQLFTQRVLFFSLWAASDAGVLSRASDPRCSTIGPICSTNLGMRASARSPITARSSSQTLACALLFHTLARPPPFAPPPLLAQRTRSRAPDLLLSSGTVDVGVPQLSMHSIREMCGVDDVLNCKLLAQHLLADFRELDSNFGQ